MPYLRGRLSGQPERNSRHGNGSSRRRDRHGRGNSEIYSLEAFGDDVAEAAELIQERWGASLIGYQFDVADIPHGDYVLAATEGHRTTLFRQGILLRAQGVQERRHLIFDTVVEEVAEILGMDPTDVHEDYGQSISD